MLRSASTPAILIYIGMNSGGISGNSWTLILNQATYSMGVPQPYPWHLERLLLISFQVGLKMAELQTTQAGIFWTDIE
ncbi:hypothetical protein D3C84_1216740 [compost metagenome]